MLPLPPQPGSRSEPRALPPTPLDPGRTTPARRFVVGTAGHVDHGKTALVRALTGVDTDRLPEEKRRGITIELGFAPFDVDDDLEATIVDVPGHRRLVHTMIAGASSVALVVLVVAANEGVMPQTREHARLCEELGVREAVVVLTKRDLVDAETLAMAESEVRELLFGRFAFDVVSCSAARGEGLGEVRAAIASRLRAMPPWSTDGPARLWVDRVFSRSGAGTIVTGTLSSGAVTRGDELSLLGASGERVVTARELHVHDRAVGRAASPTRLALNLAVPLADVRRGDLLTSDRALTRTAAFDAELRGARLRRGAVVSIHAGSAHVAAKVTRVEARDERTTLARLVLDAPLALRGGDRFVARGHASKEEPFACGGTVLDARPAARSRGEGRRALLDAVRAGDVAGVLACLLSERAPAPLLPESLHARLAIDEGAIARALSSRAKKGELVAVGAGWLTRAKLVELADQARAAVREHAAKAPLDRGLSVATLHARLAGRAGDDAADAAIRAARAKRGADDDGAIAIDGDVALLEARRVDPALEGAIARARAAVEGAGVHGVTESAFTTATAAPKGDARALLAALERRGDAARAGDLWFSRPLVDALRAKVEAHLTASPRLTVVEFKELGGLARKQAVALLELFDQAGLTRRVGDARVLARGG